MMTNLSPQLIQTRTVKSSVDAVLIPHSCPSLRLVTNGDSQWFQTRDKKNHRRSLKVFRNRRLP